MTEQHPELEQVQNFRDVGKTVNDFLGQRRVREGLFYRSARPDDASPGDKQILREQLGVRTIIDLRSKTELLKQAQKREAQLAALAQTKTNDEIAEPLQMEGVQYHEIKLTGRPFEIFLVRQLGWWDFLRFLFLLILGYRMLAINVISRQVMAPRGLVRLGLDSVDLAGADIREALMLYTSTEHLPSIVHCTQGKDRTGLIAALVLMILGVPIEAIEHDYHLTDAGLVKDKEERLAEIRELGLPDSFGNTVQGMIKGIATHFDDHYGGLNSYLDGIEFGEEERARVREILLY